MSKGLEATKRLKWGYAITHEERINLCECIEKELKALEILKDMFEVFEKDNKYHIRTLFDIQRISKEKYNLLKGIGL